MRKRLEAVLFADPDGAPALIRRLLRENARAFLPQYLLAFACMGLVAATTGASAWILKDVINEIFVNRDPATVLAIAGIVLSIFLVKGIASYGQLVVLGKIGNAIVASVQRRLFAAMLRQDIRFFEGSGMGDLATRLSHNATAARGALDLVVTALGRDLLSVIALVGVMVLQDPFMSLVALLIAPPAIYVVGKLVRRVRSVAKTQFVSQSNILSIAQETISGVRIVKAFAVEGRLGAEMDRAVAGVELQSNKIVRLLARTSPLMETLGGVAITLVILYGGYSVIELDRDPGAFVSFIAALMLAYDPARRLARLHINLSAHLVGVRLMYEVLDREPGERDGAQATPLALTQGRIRFDDVVFRYGDAPALDGLTFEAMPGQVTALVGPSGAGKSTVFALLERFYEPQGGCIRIDETDIRDVTIASLRAGLALVSQDTFLFDLSVRDNIALGRPGASEEAIRQAAREANAEEFILELDQGYDTGVGEGGGRLSGGQRQRIAIARAILRDAPILLLDEATSALDSQSEAKIQQALSRLMRGRTTLVIAHRLATVREADQIVVLDRGRVVERGTHDALFAAGGLYKRLCDLQFAEPSPTGGPADGSAGA